MKKLYSLITLGALFPSAVLAHVKWFVDSESVIENSHGLTRFFGWGSTEVLVWGLIVLITVLVFSLIDRALGEPKKVLAFAYTHEHTINRVAQIILGVFLVTVSLIWQIVLVPDYPVVDAFTQFLQIVQIAIGVAYIFNVKPQIASVTLAFLCLSLIFTHGFTAFMENVILLALAAYFFIVASKPGSTVFKWNRHAVELVRIATGVTLITFAFTEKLLYPELSISFLATHQWNFMQPLFPWFTNELFVLSTGFAEMIFGILFICGYLTRTTTLLITVFFASSVVTMLVQHQKWEVEDLVVYSAAVLFVFFGHGKTKFFHFVFPNSKLHTPLVH